LNVGLEVLNDKAIESMKSYVVVRNVNGRGEHKVRSWNILIIDIGSSN
jgi:hypothetical protein